MSARPGRTTPDGARAVAGAITALLMTGRAPYRGRPETRRGDGAV